MRLKHEPSATDFLHDLHDMPRHGCATLRMDFQTTLPDGEVGRQHPDTSKLLANCRTGKRTVKKSVISGFQFGSALLAVTHGPNSNAILGEERGCQLCVALV